MQTSTEVMMNLKKREKEGSFERRQGKWTQAECEYAMLLIEHFTSGRLPGCAGGESLRTTLSECLMCTPMRITKKLSATHAIGKCCFKKKGELTAKERVELEATRAAFIASVEKRTSGFGSERSSHLTLQPHHKKTSSGDHSSSVRQQQPDAMDQESPKTTTPQQQSSTAMAEEDTSLYVSSSGSSNGAPATTTTTQERQPRKRTRMDDWGLDLGEASWLDDPNLGGPTTAMRTDESEATGPNYQRTGWAPCLHTDATSTEPLKPSVSARLNQRGRTAVRVVATDRPGLIGDISRALQLKGLSIAGCVAETLPNDVAHDEFDIVRADSKQPVTDAAELRKLETDLEVALTPGRSASDGSGTKPPPKNSPTTSVRCPSDEGGQPGLHDDASSTNTDAENQQQRGDFSRDGSPPSKISATTLQVTVPDRPGLLKQITTSLASLSLSIVGAKIETVDSSDFNQNKTALDTFDVVDAESGGPVLDPVRLRAIEERLARDLEQVTTQSAAPLFSEADQQQATDFGPPPYAPTSQNLDVSEDAWLFSRRFGF